MTVSDEPRMTSARAGRDRLSRWIIDHQDTLGRGYANELTRHFR